MYVAPYIKIRNQSHEHVDKSTFLFFMRDGIIGNDDTIAKLVHNSSSPSTPLRLHPLTLLLWIRLEVDIAVGVKRRHFPVSH